MDHSIEILTWRKRYLQTGPKKLQRFLKCHNGQKPKPGVKPDHYVCFREKSLVQSTTDVGQLILVEFVKSRLYAVIKHMLFVKKKV